MDKTIVDSKGVGCKRSRHRKSVYTLFSPFTDHAHSPHKKNNFFRGELAC